MAVRYLVGIDLGTTNSALAYVDVRESGRPELRTFAVPQTVAAGEVSARPLLPSFLYRRGEHDLPAGAGALPWNDSPGDLVGVFARDHGAKVPGRMISSAKSWLCHTGVDRTRPLLPWTAPPDVPRLSPLDASAALLRHFVHAWDHAHPHQPLANTPVVLTVPASFDDVARELTAEAAKQAGLTQVTLLEEPQAAFYAWQHRAERPELDAGTVCAVIDVGGGTTDFSLIESVEQHGALAFVRRAVGDHLLLGGDNMDLALARSVESRLPGGKLDAAGFASLVQACRVAKEVLLGDDPPDSYAVTVVGRGRSIVAGTVSVALTAADIATVIFDGFFPEIAFGSAPERPARSGLHEMGLPYVHDPAISRHLAEFLRRHLSDRPPGAILFNGGVFQPARMRERVLTVMRSWYGPDWSPQILTSPSLDLAVAWGAAAFAWLRHTGGKRIGGGAARSYYVGVGHAAANTDGELNVLCIYPRRAEEGDEFVVPGPALELTLGEPSVFPLYSSTARGHDRPGDLLHVAPDQLRALPPLATALRSGKKGGGGPKTVPVSLLARTTAIGTLELFCAAADGGTRWKLEFATRDAGDDSEAVPPAEPTDRWPEALVEAAAACIRRCFEGEEPKPGELPKSLETALESPRHDWPSGLCRQLWGRLWEVADRRKRSPAHSARWCNLIGYCLRPGFGDSLDGFRVEQLWKLLHAPKPGEPPPTPEIGADVWIMWRRVAGGLAATHQQALFDRLRPFLLTGKSAVKPGANELAEMWRAAAALERLPTRHKVELGNALMKLLKRRPWPTYFFWSLTRIGARSLLAGPLNAVVHPDTVSIWIERLLAVPPQAGPDRPNWCFALAQMARRTGQRALDVDDDLRRRVADALRNAEADAEWQRQVEEVTELTTAERGRIFGESLPIGLRLRD